MYGYGRDDFVRSRRLFRMSGRLENYGLVDLYGYTTALRFDRLKVDTSTIYYGLIDFLRTVWSTYRLESSDCLWSAGGRVLLEQVILHV